MTQLTLADKTLFVERFPKTTDPNLQAWDAADEYLLKELSPELLAESAQQGPIVIINDTFGALACALADYRPMCVSDSYLSQVATQRNLTENGLDSDEITMQDVLAPLPATPSLVLFKLPKTTALLEDQLIRIRAVATSQTRIIAAAKAKEIHTSTLSLFEKILGETKTSLAWKKARLIYSQTAEPAMLENPYPSVWPLENTNYQITNHANVFSRGSLDIGARFFLSHLPSQKKGRMVDLGCGNGVLGLVALSQNPEAEMIFVDESFMAIESARENVMNNRADDISRCKFIANHALTNFDAKSVDTILCNPPFHQLQTITDEIAWQMFKDAKRCLTKGGELWIVGNRHLDYHHKLKRLFGGAECVASNSKFVILRSINR